MIRILCADNKIIYNAYNLVKAFFPDKEISSEADAETQPQIRVLFEQEADPSGDRKEAELNKNPLNADDIRSLYTGLKERTGRELPWGMLTGVRPVKLASKWIREHLQERDPDEDSMEEFIRWFYEDRFVSRRKAVTAFQVALKEREIIHSVMTDQPLRTDLSQAESGSGPDGGMPVRSGYSLYIGIPFCPSVCHYCSFSSGEIGSFGDKVERYLDALIREMKRKKAGKWLTEEFLSDQQQGMDKAADTQALIREYLPQPADYPTAIYIGGGTPTALSEEQLERLLENAERIFDIRAGLASGQIREYTVEAGRPDSINARKLEILRKYHVSRISVNPQTMQQKTLDRIGRRHTVAQVKEAFALAREKGFDNINMDLIMGLAGESNEDVRDTLRQIMELKPDSLTVHSLAVKRSSRIGMDRSAARAAADRIPGDKKTAACKTTDQNSLINMAAEKKPAESKNVAATTGTVNEETADIALMIEKAGAAAEEMGMKPYYLYRQKSIAGNFENTGYALPGKEGLYNVLIMEEVQSIIACGAGASSKVVLAQEIPNPQRGGKAAHIIRNENVKNIDEYIRRQS